MAMDLKWVLSADDKASGVISGVTNNIKTMESGVNTLNSRFTALVGTLGGMYVSSKLWEGITLGIKAVDDFEMAVVQSAATITSLQGGDNISQNYKAAKEYAEGLQTTLMKVDANTSLNLSNLQQITFEMTKQGILLDGNNQQQVESFTRIANAVAVYSNNGRNEMQVRQEISALLRGEVDQNSQLASMIQRTVDGPLKQQIDKWKQSGTLLQELGDRLAGFGEASQDIGKMWSSIKSSFETAVNVILKAGFTEVVKDMAGWGEKLNSYLKEHKDMIAGEIKDAWKTVKEFLITAAGIAKTLYNNFEPFAVFFIGGALIKGISGAVGMMRELLAVATAARAVMITTGVLSGGAAIAGAAGGASAIGGAVAGGGVMATLGGAALGTLGAGVAGLGLGYALQPVVRWADKKMYQGFGVNLTGEAMYNEAMGRESEADGRLSAIMAKRGNSTTGGPPKIDPQDTEEQIKKKIEMGEKELAVFKANQERMTDAAKHASEMTLADLKQRYASGSISTREYYDQEKNIAISTAEAKLKNVSDYLKKEQEMLSFIRTKRHGTDNPEYQSELAKNIQAVRAVSDADAELKKTMIVEEGKFSEALRKREEEYTKLISKAQEEAGEFVKAAETRIEAEKKSIDYLRLEREALDGTQAAVTALAGKEQEFSAQKIQGQIKENELRRTYEESTQRLIDELGLLNGANKEQVRIESDLRTQKAGMLALQEKLSLATAQGNQVAISGLTQQISLQSQLNQKKQEQLAQQQMTGVYNGTIVGFDGDTPIYSSDWKKGQYEYQSPYANTSQSPEPSSSSFVNANAFPSALNSPFLGGMATGTNYVPADGYAYLHKGEAVVPVAYNSKSSGAGDVSISGGINVTVQGGNTSEETARDIARKIFPFLREYQGRYRA